MVEQWHHLPQLVDDHQPALARTLQDSQIEQHIQMFFEVSEKWQFCRRDMLELSVKGDSQHLEKAHSLPVVFTIGEMTDWFLKSAVQDIESKELYGISDVI